ncbi:pimeloyl-ACP methyl ester carboxylesterase [Halospina denitrificans]|uniref:Pimeloyl-ACP methyl ester carboxylesterase n=1 Tax=Halospina denitrificans TaxID=332522 RepID=A0A4R7K1X7_9GAMM|nr:alpha/beta hydrolase [Halospina denitrificans]TDT44027.1 pimeloyl-ACP methyl ester carboxylesterase [Halospina denitrificans]
MLNEDVGSSLLDPEQAESDGLQRWQDAGSWFRYGEHAIFSRLAGQGEVLLLLHGFPSASWDWHPVWPALSEHYQLMATDMLGFGFSDKPQEQEYSIIDQADLQQGWLEEMGVTRVHILAHDYGATVAQELLAREQEGSLGFAIDSVAFMNSALFPEVHQPILIQKLLQSPFGGLVSRALTKGVFQANFRKIFGPDTQPTRSDIEDFWQLLIYNNGRGIIHQLIHYMEERRIHRHRWVGALQAMRQPALLIWGGADPVSGKAMVERYRELVGSANIAVLEGVGHYPHFEAPAETLQHYLRFRRGIKTSTD